jgi:hypothetical protein
MSLKALCESRVNIEADKPYLIAFAGSKASSKVFGIYDRENWAEYLFLCYLHVRCDIFKNRGFDIILLKIFRTYATSMT